MNTTDATPEQMRDMIIDTYELLQEYKYNVKVADSEFQHAVSQLPEFTEFNRLKDQTKTAGERLKSKINTTENLTELRSVLNDAKLLADGQKALLSKMLVKQATITKNRSVSVGSGGQKEILLTAKLGKDAPEQLDMFDEASE